MKVHCDVCGLEADTEDAKRRLRGAKPSREEPVVPDGPHWIPAAFSIRRERCGTWRTLDTQFQQAQQDARA